MNHFFAANLNLLSSIFEEKQLEKISVIQESIAFDDSEHGEYSDVIYLPSGLGIANVSKSSKEAYIASFNNPKRWQTPLFSFQGCQYTSASSAFSAAIDSEYRPFLEYVMSSEINSAANINQPGKPTLIVCGFLNLVSLVEVIDDLPLLTSIVLLEHSLEKVACACSMFDFQLLIEKLKQLGISFTILFKNDSDALIAAFQSYLLNTSPTSVYNIQIVQPNIPSPVFTRFMGWIESPQGLKVIVDMLFGNETDEINQVMNVAMNIGDSNSLNIFNPNNLDVVDEEKSIILTASGPSLDDDIPYLQSVSNTHAIVASGSSIGTLLRNNIQPSALVVLEMSSLVYYDLLELVYEGYNFDGIVLIASFSVDPRIRSLFSSFTGFSRPSLSTLTMIIDSLRPSILPQAGPQVANAALEVLLRLGFKKFVLSGCDFSSPYPSRSRSKDAIGESIRDLDLPSEGRNGSIVYSDAELLATSVFFSNMLELYSASAITYGDGIILSNTSFVSRDNKCSLISKLEFFDSLNVQILNEIDTLNALSLPMQALLQEASIETINLCTEIKGQIQNTDSYDRSIKSYFDRLFLFARPQDEKPGRTLSLRFHRSILTLLVRQMAIDATPDKINDVTTVIACQLDLLTSVTSKYFQELASIVSLSVPVSSWDPLILKRRFH